MREKVREQTWKLARTRYRTQEQFPEKSQEKGKNVYPILKEAIRNRKMGTLVRDKPYIDGLEYCPEHSEP